jgi:hypothetical protein
MFEQNLKFLGLIYMLLKESRNPFKYVYKIERMVEYLKAKKRSQYVLFCDAMDTIICKDPQLIVDIFESKKCDILFTSTLSRCGWVCMPDKQVWAESIAGRSRYLNSGVYIGKWECVLAFLEEAKKYITPDSITIEQYLSSGRGIKDDRLCKLLPKYPMGAPDQDIFRFIHPQFYPGVQVDFKNELVYRN